MLRYTYIDYLVLFMVYTHTHYILIYITNLSPGLPEPQREARS